MTRFLKTDDGKLINAERVEYIKTVKDKAVQSLAMVTFRPPLRATSTRPSAPWRRWSPPRLVMCVFTTKAKGTTDR